MFIADNAILRYMADSNDSEFLLLPQNIGKNVYVIGMPNDEGFKHTINLTLRVLSECGKISEIYKKYAKWLDSPPYVIPSSPTDRDEFVRLFPSVDQADCQHQQTVNQTTLETSRTVTSTVLITKPVSSTISETLSVDKPTSEKIPETLPATGRGKNDFLLSTFLWCMFV